MNNDTILEQLPSSQLGTKTYWDDIYENELKNFAENEDDEGENWFGHQRMVKVIKYIMKQKDLLPLNSNILDVGCGNGLFVHHMVEEGYSNVYGIDYSQQAIELADAIALSRDVKTQCHFSQADFLDPSTWKINDVTFDLCHDKGTFDAVCLNPDNAKEKSRLYIKNLKTLLKEGSWFLITSCNWTGDEIKKHFSDGFEFVCDIPAPTFQFGGQSGQTVTSNVFRLCPNSLSSEIQFNSNKDKDINKSIKCFDCENKIGEPACERESTFQDCHLARARCGKLTLGDVMKKYCVPRRLFETCKIIVGEPCKLELCDTDFCNGVITTPKRTIRQQKHQHSPTENSSRALRPGKTFIGVVFIMTSLVYCF